jgi:polygalacturonase
MLVGQSADQVWMEGERTAAAVQQPVISAKVFPITKYGASVKGTADKNGKAIAKAIDAASKAGGGNVVVPAGDYLTGPITLKSKINLVVEKGATLKFSTNQADYLPVVLTRWEGIDCYTLHPLIYAIDAQDVAITGEGTIDGQASNDNWWSMSGSPRFGWKEGMKSQRLPGLGRPKLTGFEQNNVPVDQRVMGLDDALRPQLINFYRCERVKIEGVTLRNSPFWVIHPVFVDHLTVRKVSIISHGPNSDGCDPESSKNVLIEDCFFDTGDDCIAIKSGRNNDGRKWNIPSENIVVRNCKMKNGHGGVVIGSEISGGFRNLWVENCVMDSPELDRVIRIKTSLCRGGIIENVFVRNVTVGQCKEAVLKINLAYEPKEECNRSFPPLVRNVILQNVTSNKSRYGVYIVGLDDVVNVSDISLTNCVFNGVKDGDNIKGAKNISYVNYKLNSQVIEP